MEPELKANSWKISSRLAVIVLLVVFTPFFITGVHAEGKDYAIFFYSAIVLLILPDLAILVFLRPVSISLNDDHISLRYYTGTKTLVRLSNIKGYSEAIEHTRQRYRIEKWSGIVLYLHNGRPVYISGITIDTSHIVEYLKEHQINFYGTEIIPAWFLLFRYKYDKL